MGVGGLRYNSIEALRQGTEIKKIKVNEHLLPRLAVSLNMHLSKLCVLGAEVQLCRLSTTSFHQRLFFLIFVPLIFFFFFASSCLRRAAGILLLLPPPSGSTLAVPRQARHSDYECHFLHVRVLDLCFYIFIVTFVIITRNCKNYSAKNPYP